jgi:site-specific DNA-methyltransferase (adenine-specific)
VKRAAIEPSYVDEAVALYTGSCFDVMHSLASRRGGPPLVSLVATDPPFSDHVHTNAKKDAGGRRWRSAGGAGQVPERIDPAKLITFAPWTMKDIARMLAAAATFSPKWCVAHMDWRHAAELERVPAHRPGWSFIRLGVWVKVNGTPQFTGDRPGQGWEAISFLHRPAAGALSWNGGGDSSVFTGLPCRPASYPTEKPAWLARRLVELFTEPGDLILDPCSGSGTFCRAAKDLGRRAIGIDLDPEATKLAVEKMRPPAHPMMHFPEPAITEQSPLFDVPPSHRPEEKP